MIDIDSLLTTAEVAELLRVHPDTVKKWRYKPDHELSFIKVSPNVVRYQRDALDYFLSKREA